MRNLVLACAVAVGATHACTVQAHALTGHDPCEMFYLTAGPVFAYQQNADATPHAVGDKARKACWKLHT